MVATTQVSVFKEKVLNLEGANLIKEKILLATKIAEKMSELRGAVLKVGQLLSLDAGDFLPPEAVEILQKLQKDVEPIEFEIIEKQLKSELKEKFNKLVIEKNPLAVASIGQIHIAHCEGQDLVLKVQYPQIKETIPADIKMLRFILNQWSFIFKKSINFDLLLNELEQTLILETDYLIEAQNLVRAREMFQTDQRFLVPRIYPELCTGKTLAMEKMPGLTLSEWIKKNPSKSDKEEIGKNLLDLYLLEFFTFGFVQTDPNPGNFLVTDDKKIVLLDFGATKEYDKVFRGQYLSLLKATYENDNEKILSLSHEFDLLSPLESQTTKDIYCKMMRSTIEPFRIDRPFSFAGLEYAKESKDNVINFMKSCQYSPPPQNIFFLHRKLGGIFQVLKQMDVSINLNHYWLNIIK